MTPQPNKIQPLVVMNYFGLGEEGGDLQRWAASTATSAQKLYELSSCSTVARCQHFLLSRSATFEQQLNFKLIGSLINCWGAVSSNARYRTCGQLLPLPVGVTPRVGWRSQPHSSPCGTLGFFQALAEGELPGLRLWGQLQGSALSQAAAAVRCTFTYKIWCLDVYLELSSMERRVWGFWVTYNANIR